MKGRDKDALRFVTPWEAMKALGDRIFAAIFDIRLFVTALLQPRKLCWPFLVKEAVAGPDCSPGFA